MRRQDKMPARNKKNFRPTEKGAGMTRAGVAAYRRMNPGSKLKTAVTGKVKPGSKAAKRRKSFCARSAGQMKKFPKAAKDPNSRLRQARRRWKCKISPLKEGPYKKGLVKNLMKARREVKVALDKKDKTLERKARNKVHKFKKKLGER